MASKIRLHIENALAARGALVATSCGRWVRPSEAVTQAHLDDVTCKTCRARALAVGPIKPRSHAARPAGLVPAEQFNAELHLALAELSELGAHAGAPPTLTPDLWAASCRGAVSGRCRAPGCVLCAHHAEVERWAYAAPWSTAPVLEKPEGACRWSSLDAALRALLRARSHGGGAALALRSATGPLTDRLRDGSLAVDARDPRRRDPRAITATHDELDVELRLRTAAQQTAGDLEADALVECVLARVLDEPISFAELALRHGAVEAVVRASVRRTRALAGALLVEAGLVAVAPRSTRDQVALTTVLRANDNDMQEAAPC